MPSLNNKTQKPLSIPLPGGKTLHLSPGKTAQIAANAVGHAPIQKLVEAGEVEIIVDDSRATGGPGGGKKGRSMHGYGSTGGIRRSGDR